MMRRFVFKGPGKDTIIRGELFERGVVHQVDEDFANLLEHNNSFTEVKKVSKETKRIKKLMK